MLEVTIQWDSGPETYTKIPKYNETNQTKPLLIEVDEITRALSLDFSLENATAKVVLSNHESHFTQKMQTEEPLGKDIVIKDGIDIFTGKICDNPDHSNPNYFVVKGDIFSLLQAPVNLEISKDRFPNVPEGNQGWGNILYGTASVSPGMMKAIRIDTNKYLASYTPLSVILDVTTKEGTSILSGITWNIENGYTYINYTSTDEYICFSAKGPEENDNLVENPAYMLQKLIQDFSNGQFEIEGVEESAPVFTDRDYKGNILFIDDNITWQKLFSLFSKNFNCRVFPTRQGTIKIKVIRWGMETPKMTIHPTYLKGFKFNRELKQIRKKWMRQYSWDMTQGKFLRTEFDIPGGPSEKLGEFQHKLMVRDICSRDVALREAFFQKQPLIMYSFSLPGEFANQIELADTVLIKHRKNLFKNETRQVQILREKRKPGSGFVTFEGYDMTEINKRTFILQEPGHPEVAVLGETDGPTLW